MTASAATSVSLSDPAALGAALNAGDEEMCQKLMLRALDYGTGSFDDKVSKRIEETVQWFEDSIGIIANANENSTENATATANLASSLETIEDALVDCLWLMGSTLTSLKWSVPEPSVSTTTSSPGGSNSQAFHPSVRALIVIVRALLSASFWKGSSSRSSFASKLQENWFPVLLERVGIIKVNANAGNVKPGSADDLMKRLRQYNTATNYKQQKYNLLQEESEGYSKVLQCLCGSSSNSDSDSNARESYGDSDRSFLWKLVGTFELDPNRILDLALDVLEAKLQAANAKRKGKINSNINGNFLSQPPMLVDEIRWLLDLIQDCSTEKLPALMKFKLRQQDSQQDTSSLLETIAVLVQNGAMDLATFVEDYFESTLGADIETAYGIFRKKERDRVIALSRVSLSGATSDKESPKQIDLRNKLKLAMGKLKLISGSGSGSKGTDDKANDNDGSNGRILSLLLILIQWGEWEQVTPLLSSAASSSNSLSSPSLCLWGKLCCLMPESFGSAILDVTEARMLTARIRTGSIAPKLNHSSTGKSSSAESASTSEEGDSESTISTMKDLVHIVRSISNPLSRLISSGCIRSRPVLYCNLCRLLRSILTNIVTESEVSAIHSVPQEVFSFLDTVLVPSLSLFPSNPSISTELWSVLEILPYDIRYKLYEGWKGSGLEKQGLVGGGTKPLPNVESEMVAGKATRYSLKRLSKDNIRDMSRQLAKVTHSNPLVVFATILSQIESYDNMVEVMVEAQRFVNPLGLDVLGHCVLGRLSGTSGGVNRSRLKEDGVHVSQWLQSLESFAGEFYKTRPAVEFRGILSYLMEQLKVGNVMELGMLRTLLKVAGGYSFADYSPAASLNETQLDGRSGSVTLKRETMSFGIVEETNPFATDHVRSVLQTDGLGVSLLILIAQARDRIIFDSAKGAFKEVKLVGNLYDTCQVVMSILLEFLTDDDGKESDGSLSNNSHISKYSRFLPSFQDLQRNYGLDMATAWLLCRPCVKAALEVESEGSVEIISSLTRFELSEDVRKSYSDSLPESVWKTLTPQLFEFFYTNSFYDVYCPEGVLTSEISRIGKEVERIKGLKPPISTNELDELERLKAVSKELDVDMKKQKDHVESTLKGLNEEKAKFFTSEEVTPEAARAFLMYCIYPRTTQSPDDAMYCAAIAFRLHRIWTPGFSIMHYLDELISIVSGALFGVTEAEAANLAILLWQTLKVVNNWRHKDGLYDKEVLGKPGSYMKTTEDGVASTNPVSHKDFIKLYNKWQYSLAEALTGCLQSTEYIHTRAGLVVLSRLVNVFPTGPSLGNRLLKVLEPLQDESSSRPDIRASAKAYGMMLGKARDEGKWVEEDEGAAKARADKEKEVAEERKKKIEQSFQELEQDSKNITAQIGNDDRRDRPRGGTRDGFNNQDRRVDNSRNGGAGGGRDAPSSNRTGSDNSRMENGRDRRPNSDGDRRSTQGRDSNDDLKDDRGRGRRSGGDDDRRGSSNRDGGDLSQRGDSRDDGRWRRDGSGTGSGPPRYTKRSRPSSPVADRDADRSNGNSKRPRIDEYNNNNYPSRRSGPSRSPEPPRTTRRQNSRR